MCHRSRRQKNSQTGAPGAAASGSIAKERLKLMIDAEKQKLDDGTLESIRQEIGSVITKYVDIEPENVEVRITLKDYRKRA